MIPVLVAALLAWSLGQLVAIVVVVVWPGLSARLVDARWRLSKPDPVLVERMAPAFAKMGAAARASGLTVEEAAGALAKGAV